MPRRSLGPNHNSQSASSTLTPVCTGGFLAVLPITPIPPDRDPIGEPSSKPGGVRAMLALAAGMLATTLPGQTTFIFNGSADFQEFPHLGFRFAWFDAENWSNGIPDSNVDAVIIPRPTQSDYIDLGTNAASSRTLTVTTDVRVGPTTIQNGSLQLSNVLNYSLRVGVASSDTQEFHTVSVGFQNVSLASDGFAAIGTRPSDLSGGELTGSLTLKGSSWLHNGLIEVGLNGGTGKLTLEEGSTLSGGIGTAPSASFGHRSDEGYVLSVGADSTAIFNEVSLNGRADIIGTISVQKLTVGDTADGNLELRFQNTDQARDLGETTVGANSRGEIDVHQHTAFASLTLGRDDLGTLQVGGNIVDVAITIGESGPLAALLKPLVLGMNTGGTGTLILSDFEVPEEVAGPRMLTVNGGGIIGKYGTGMLAVSGNSTVTFTGDLIVGDSAFDGQGTGHVSIGAGGRLVARDMYVGTNQNELFGSVSLFPTGTGTLQVDTGGVVEVTGSNAVNPGRIFIGSGGTLSGSGLASLGDGTVVNIGEISPGNSPGMLTIDGDLVFNIPFGFSPTGGKLVIELGGLTGGVDYDVLHVTGDADLTGGILELFLLPGFTQPDQFSFNFLQVDGLLTGSFFSLIDHTGWGLTLDDLVFGEHGVSFGTRPATSVPDTASTAALLFLAALGLILAHRRRL